MTTLSCPACCGPRLTPRVKLPGTSRLFRCGECRHGFVVQAPDSASLSLYDSAYEGFRRDEVFEAAAVEELRTNFVSRIHPPARVLDVGCGRGDFMSAAATLGYDVFGVDVSSAAVDLCRSRGLQALQTPLSEFRPDQPFDFVTMWDVIEHVDSPAEMIAAAHALLKPGGYLVVKTPAVSAWTIGMTGLIPRLAGALLQVPAHIQFFTAESLQHLFQRSNFSAPVWLEGRPMRGIPKKGTLRKRAARTVVRTITRLGGDTNFYVFVRA